MLLDPKKKKYDNASRTLSQNMFYISRKCYLFLKNKMNFNLPHENSLINWTPIKNLQPGFFNTGLNVFKKNINSLEQSDRDFAVLVFDEMSIRAELKYNETLDIIDGFDDNGYHRDNTLATQICVFMVKGLFSQWSYLLNYFVSGKGLTGDCICNIIKDNVALLSNLGVTIRAVVCDQSSANRKTFNFFEITPERPFLKLDDRKIFFIFDFPHLLKSLRNGLLKDDLRTPDGTVSFNVVRELWQREQNLPTKMCPKLSRQHIDPKNFEKMKVKLATQVFSRTVNAAIKTIIKTGGFASCKEEVAISTANFIEKIDAVFDCMNSGSLYADNPNRCAIQLNNVPYLHIKSFISYLDNVKFVSKTQVHFLKGMKISLNAVLQMSDDFLKGNTFFLMTKSLNQDKLENTFSIFRQRGGYNKNPSVAELNKIITKLMCCKMIQATSSGNCESIIENVLEENVLADSSLIQENELPEETYFQEEMAIEHCIIRDIPVDVVLEDCLPSIRYFSGYVAYRILPKLGCAKCPRDIIKEGQKLTTPSELLIFYKNYSKQTDFGSLQAPTDPYFDMCRKHISIFLAIFKNSPEIEGIKDLIIKKMCF